jgi:hypothetical protein
MKDIRKAYIARKTVHPRTIGITNQPAKSGDSRITDATPINIQNHTSATLSIPPHHSSGWILVVLSEAIFKQKSKIPSAHPESKIGSHLIIHAQRIPRSPNPPNSCQKGKNSWSIYTMS